MGRSNRLPAALAVSWLEIAPKLPRDHILLMNLCGRGDKDIFTVAAALGVTL